MVPDEDNLSVLHALIIGPKDTPYEGEFFHFLVQYLYRYPVVSPIVKVMITRDGSVRFNPSLHTSGKVLSLNAWNWTRMDFSLDLHPISDMLENFLR